MKQHNIHALRVINIARRFFMQPPAQKDSNLTVEKGVADLLKRMIPAYSLALLISFAAHSQIKVVCIGNSITAGSYPAQLNKILGDEWELKNCGVSGTTLLRNGDAPYYKTKVYADAKAFHPDVVIIKLGTNDSKPQNWKHGADYYKDYTMMIKELKALPSKPFIIICYPVPAYSSGWGINDTVIRYEILPKLKAIAHDNHVRLINLYKPMSNHPEWFPDGIHPNKEGSGEIAGVISKKLLKYKRKIVKRKRSSR